ncbi:MAG: hypothetical protein ABR909_12930 [Candidatus Bathyarchaeia archaeon]|jgi:beta-lactamase regulating signal transducer with metallopeptidase domain
MSASSPLSFPQKVSENLKFCPPTSPSTPTLTPIITSAPLTSPKPTSQTNTTMLIIFIAVVAAIVLTLILIVRRRKFRLLKPGKLSENAQVQAYQPL